MNKLTPRTGTSKKQTFIQGTMILLAAGIVNRILGFIPRIALPRIIGAEGVGIYQLGYPFFLVLVTIIIRRDSACGGQADIRSGNGEQTAKFRIRPPRQPDADRRFGHSVHGAFRLACALGDEPYPDGFARLLHVYQYEPDAGHRCRIIRLQRLFSRQAKHDPFRRLKHHRNRGQNRLHVMVRLPAAAQGDCLCRGRSDAWGNG